jgi:hypothetical protein
VKRWAFLFQNGDYLFDEIIRPAKFFMAEESAIGLKSEIGAPYTISGRMTAKHLAGVVSFNTALYQSPHQC